MPLNAVLGRRRGFGTVPKDMKMELGQVIAERRLRLSDSPGREVWVRLGLPRPFPDAPFGDYYCPYQIVGIGDERVRHAGGVDGLQALELALLVLPTELNVLRRTFPGLGWDDGPDGQYAFSDTLMSYPPTAASSEKP